MDEKKPNKNLRRERELKGWSQRALAGFINTNEQAVNRWESGHHKPNRHFQTQLCQLFGKSAAELGFMDEPPATKEPEQTAIDAEKENIEELFSLLAILQGIMVSANEQGGMDLNKLRRLLLQGTIGLAASTVLSGQTQFVVAQPPFVSAISEEFIAKSDATIRYCWQLYYSGGAFLVEQFLPAFLSQIIPLTQQSSKYQAPLANIVSRAYQLTWLLSLQHQDFGQALASTKQSFIYAELAKDPNLLLASLVREAHTFFHLKNPIHQLSLHEKAMQYAPNASPLLKSWLYLVLGESHAHLQHETEADHFIKLARDTFPEKPDQDPNYSYVPVDGFWFANHEVMAYLHLHQASNAWDTLTKFDKVDPSIPLCVEFTNRQLATLYALDDLGETCKYLEIAAPAAKQSGSGLRYNEVCTVYMNMLRKWPHESKVSSLESLLR